MIKHVWFDFANTLFKYTPEYKRVHDELLYKTYSQVVKRPVAKELKREYNALYEKYKTNSHVFISLGKDPDFWVATQAKLKKENYIDHSIDLPSLFRKIRKKRIKISLFTNGLREEVLRILPHLHLSLQDFDHLLTGEMVEKKPSLDGFYKIIELSGVKPQEILYVGDRIPAEILPAKKVGLKTALVWSDKQKTEADFTLDHISEVINCLE